MTVNASWSSSQSIVYTVMSGTLTTCLLKYWLIKTEPNLCVFHDCDGLCVVQACRVCLHVDSFLHCFDYVTGALGLFTAVPAFIISKISNQAPTIAQSIEHVFKLSMFKIEYFCTKHFICIQYVLCMNCVHIEKHVETQNTVWSRNWVTNDVAVTDF